LTCIKHLRKQTTDQRRRTAPFLSSADVIAQTVVPSPLVLSRWALRQHDRQLHQQDRQAWPTDQARDDVEPHTSMSALGQKQTRAPQ